MKTKNNFLQISSGISFVILSIAILIYSLGSVKAEKESATPVFSKMSPPASGKYAFEYIVSTTPSGVFYWHMMVYNSETGKCKMFYWSKDDQKWYENFDGQTPDVSGL